MKKVGFFLLFLGVILILTLFILMKYWKNENGSINIPKQEKVLPEIALSQRPVVSLIPSPDGHWLKLKIDKILIEANSLDYELTYNLADGRVQGVPGTVRLQETKFIEKNLLLGSESSGKFRYDEGIEGGELTLRFRDETGKLVAKFVTKFNFFSSEKELESTDRAFRVIFDKTPLRTFFIVMETIGYPGEINLDENTKIYGAFSSTSNKYGASIQINGSSDLSYWDGKVWRKGFDGFSSGIFVNRIL